jgi:cyclic-di-GMP phosphodiesterase TipF (flagellum assembly factor)
VSADVLLNQLLDDDARRRVPALKDLHYSDYAALTRRYGVELIAEKVEQERQVVDILDLEVGFAQGHLFGEPRAIRDAVLAETPPPPEMLRGAGWRRNAG